MQQICVHSEQPPASCNIEEDTFQTGARRVRIDVHYGDNPDETSWELVDASRSTTTVASVAGDVVDENVLVSSYASVEPGIYEFQVQGNGM